MSRTRYTLLTCLAMALFGFILVGWRIFSPQSPVKLNLPIQIINQSDVAIEQIELIGVQGNTTCEFEDIGSDSSRQTSAPLDFMYQDQQIIVSDSTGIISKGKYTAPDVNDSASIEYLAKDDEGNILVQSSSTIPSQVHPKGFIIKITDDFKVHVKSEWQVNW
ncbi:hypothetical protein [Gimesia aquarii]|uniref:Uncharacterized protein n=1 Tax=Gimesia aquarii TaxID=2527964 RepID=A0A517WU03_9PLAN|nr:hypothetical protein [Gimesia aquarii]QDU08711.1 hypothetical protein V202x_20810 [Gimesia aquarii]